MVRLAAALGAAAMLGACERPADRAEPARAPGPMRIAVTIPPLAGLIRALAPADAQITVLMTPGRSEHGYEFTPADLARLGSADLVVYIGMHLEPRVESFLNDHPSKRRVDLCLAAAAGITDAGAISEPAGDDHDDHNHDVAPGLKMVGEPGQRHDYDHQPSRDDHAADEHEGHLHGPVDPHLWLDPVLVIKAVPALEDAVQRAAANAGLNPGDVPARAAALLTRLKALDDKYRAALAPFAGAFIVTHHSAWERLAHRYGLRVAAVIREIETGEPTPGKIAASVDAIKAQHVAAVFVEPQFNPDAARRIAEAAGVKLRTLDPLGEGEYFELMDRNLEQLVAGLSAK